MANINPLMSANAANPALNAPRPAEQIQKTPVRVEAEKQDVRQQTETEKPEAQERELDHVIAVSKDGDTVQASDEAVRELNEEETIGRVIGDPENERIRREQEGEDSRTREELLRLELERSEAIREAQMEAVREEQEERMEETAEAEPNKVLADEKETIASEGQINSFIGYSDAELERMYLQGNISKFDYDKEMESRTAEEEARREELTDFALETTDQAAQLERSERQGEEIERAFSDNANEKLDAAERVQILQVMQRTAQTENSDPNQIAPLANFALS
ncbi:MAG: hypothetical protein K6G16_07660 [Lachnospiraceae bacterium]|nr:hypothetical protein [Lachnospiraceae bacterium]